MIYDVLANERDDEYNKDHIGMSFFAIDDIVTVPNVIHGIVNDNVFFNDGSTISGNGWTAFKRKSDHMINNITWSETADVKHLEYQQTFS
jgi:hypothetical protein